MFATVCKTFYFDAAHKIDCFGQGHKCGHLHGHTWEVEISVAGSVSKETGIVIDYYAIMAAWATLHDQIDHKYLNEVEGLEIPTTENIAAWLWVRLEPWLTGSHYRLSRLSIREGKGDRCEFFGAL